MAYLKQRMDGTLTAHPHKLRAMLKNKINELLRQYPLDEVLGEIAHQRPSFDIHISMAAVKANGAAIDASAEVK